MNLRCEDLLNFLSAYIDGELDAELTAAAREHLATCQNCSIALDSTQRTILLYREQGQTEVLGGARREALYARIAAAFAQPPAAPENS